LLFIKAYIYMKKILITGGAGFIGFFLAKKLANDDNYKITLIDNLSRGQLDDELNSLLENENVNFIQGDLNDKELFSKLDKDFDYIYHLAAVIGVQNVNSNPDKVLYVNALTTINVFEYARTLENLKKVVFSSTSEVYAGTLKQGFLPVPTPEDVILCVDDMENERSTYALSKIYGESIAKTYSKKYNIPITILRYHNVYGPRMGYQHVIPELILKINKLDLIDLNSPTHTRAFCYIDDAIQATILCCEKTETKNQIVNIGNSTDEISINTLAKKISGALNKNIQINEMPNTIGSPERRCPDVTKLKNLTGYTPQIQLNEGIKKTSEWYLREGANRR